jgi:AbrB family looped-hinge helix DNA binding protein
MQTLITSKFQTTIPKKIREELLLSEKDALDWKIEEGRIVVSLVRTDFLRHRNSVHTGPGDIAKDIQDARAKRAGRYK